MRIPLPASLLLGFLLALVAIAPATGQERGTPAAGPPASTELSEIRELLRAQQELLEAQRAELRELRALVERLVGPGRAAAAGGAGDATPALRLAASGTSAAQGGEPLGERVGRLENDLGETRKALEGRLRPLGPFHFSGDLRYRLEPFFGGPADRSLERVRQRIRLRVNANARLNDEISGGLTLASGDPNEPISNNQTLTESFTRKPVAIDRAFLTYQPRWWKPLSLTAGKFAYTWYRTELVWDNDLNPEGISASLTFPLKGSPLDKVVLVGFQLPFHEVAGRGLTDSSAVYGGQVQTHWREAGPATFSGYAAFYNFHRADPIAEALAQRSLTGAPRLLASGVANSRTSSAPFQFASRFGLLDLIGQLEVDTGRARWPVRLLFEFVQNTRACANRDALAPGATLTAPCNPRDRQAWWAEARLGRGEERGDWNFSYTRIYAEREAVLGAFNYSDLRQSSHLTGHRLGADYKALRNVSLSFTGLFGRPLATPEAYLKRLQLDVLYTF